MIKLLLGGSPCTYWSIAQKSNRETEASGMGWELFKNYLIAKEKFKPDYFFYENNVSAAKPIKDEIKKQLGVWDGTFLMPYTDMRYIEINSALVSAQNRERFYVHNCGEVGQPKDKGILLKDVLEKRKFVVSDNVADCKTVQNALPKLVEKYGYIPKMFNVYNLQEITDKSSTLSTGSMVTSSCATLITEPVCLQEQLHGRKANVDGTYDRRYEARTDGKTGTLTPTMRQNAVAVPLNITADGKAQCLRASYYKDGIRNLVANDIDKRTCVAEHIGYAEPTEFDGDGKPKKAYCYADGKIHTVYEVKDGKITIKGKEYPIKLLDGFYIIRKLTVTECRRLQTIPDWYKMPCSDTQNYKMLGNGWTVEVIKHILSHIPNITQEPIEVLSMYDGISCGQIALKELGANVIKYYATEIDKYAIQTTQTNFPDTIQLGDAFQVRDENWRLI